MDGGYRSEHCGEQKEKNVSCNAARIPPLLRHASLCYIVTRRATACERSPRGANGYRPNVALGLIITAALNHDVFCVELRQPNSVALAGPTGVPCQEFFRA